ncbi:MAG: SMC-Scp complex subunit ScpB [Chlamydiota bacterium]|nr:SMC-Scp complex subunit ScpB [Chlamydiota bacterium]
MSNEINLFEEEVETSSIIKKTNPRKSYHQESFPGILEKIEEAEQEKKRENEAQLQVKRLIEALLFASSEPISFNKIREVTDQLTPLKPKQLKEILLELQNEYLSQQRGYRLHEVGPGYLLRTCEEFSPYIELLYRNKRTEKLSQAAAEVLAIIAYRQPITRPQIEGIRGVDSSGVVASLLERGLIAPVGKLEAPGRPTLYGITNDFLSHFGLKDVEELPTVEDDNNNQ